MSKKSDKKLAELLQKMDALTARNEQFQKEIQMLRQEIYNLQLPSEEKHKQPQAVKMEKEEVPETTPTQQPEHASKNQVAPSLKTQKEKSSIEEFIGGRLINIVGISITVIGIGIGAKYAIDRNWLSPLVRIVIGYFTGIVLMGIGLRVRKKYDVFSAAIFSGGIAVMYFMSFFAYSFYSLVPATAAFVLMLLFTIFTIIAALQYGRQIIAHLGLVGAYAIPFITDTGIDNTVVLFLYMFIINLGVLFLAFKKDWKALNYVAFGFTWLIYLTWYFEDYAYDYEHMNTFLFSTLFFLVFYFMVLAYKLIRTEKFKVGDIVLLLINSFIFYGTGYHTIDIGMEASEYLGLFTLGNALLHLIIALILTTKKIPDNNFRLFIIGLVITFITLAIPVQLNGYWVTLLWIVEAIVLFWIGRARKTTIYEYLSFPLIFLAFFSLVHDWISVYPDFRASGDEVSVPFILNIHFLNSILVALGFGVLAILNKNKKYIESRSESIPFLGFLNYALPVLVFIVLFYAVRNEIVTYWNKQMADFSFKVSETNRHIRLFRRLWLHDYYMFYTSALLVLNNRLFKSKVFSYILHYLSMIFLLGFIILGSRRIGLLREQDAVEFTSNRLGTGSMAIYIGYISYIFTGLLLFLNYTSIKTLDLSKVFRKLFSVFAHFIILGTLTGELFHSLDKFFLAENPNIFLSILWGLYALILIVAGIANKRKHLRISAIILFGITLLKLFMYDISNVTTLGRFVLLLSLGLLLLVIGFLYAKYKHIILMKDED